MEWKSIETAPKDGSRILCWAQGWRSPVFLVWKTNRRITGAHERGEMLDWTDSYFGDPNEMDDYDFAADCRPTHWLPLTTPGQG